MWCAFGGRVFRAPVFRTWWRVGPWTLFIVGRALKIGSCNSRNYRSDWYGINTGVEREYFKPAVSYFSKTDLYPLKTHFSCYASAASAISQYLSQDPRPYAILSEYAYLVPLALRRSPVNAAVYYNEGLTLPGGELQRNEWEKTWIKTLENKAARFVVVSDPIEAGIRPPNPLANVSSLLIIRDYLKLNFRPVLSQSPLQLMERVSPSPETDERAVTSVR